MTEPRRRRLLAALLVGVPLLALSALLVGTGLQAWSLLTFAPPEGGGWWGQAPRPVTQREPVGLGRGWRSIQVAGPVGRLSGWVVEGGPEVVLLVHGYGGQKGQLLKTARPLAELGYTVVLADLRAVGDSEGELTSLGWHEAEDVLAFLAYIQEELGDPQPVLYGFSLGGAAVLRAAGPLGAPCQAVVVEATFARAGNAVRRRAALLGWPTWGLPELQLGFAGLWARFPPWAHAPEAFAAQVRCPTLVVQGDQDPRVGVEEAEALGRALAGPARLLVVPGLDHEQLARDHLPLWRAEVGPWLVANGGATAHQPNSSATRPTP